MKGSAHIDRDMVFGRYYELPAPELKAPFTYNDYEDSIRYDNRNSKPECKGFIADTSVQEYITGKAACIIP